MSMSAVAKMAARHAQANESIDQDFRRVPLHKLRSGNTIKFPIHADDGTLLLAEGSEITQRILEILEQRGHSTVLVHRMETAASASLEPLGTLTDVPATRIGTAIGRHNRATRKLDYELAEQIAGARKRVESPFIKEIPRPGIVAYSETLTTEIFTKQESFITTLRASMQQMTQSGIDGRAQTEGVISDYLKFIVEDIDLFTSIASTPNICNYPHRHSLHTAMLSLTMGVHAGLSEESLHTLALGAMLHDIGMLRIPRSIWMSKQQILPHQQLTMMAHPIYSVEMLLNVEGMPPEVKYIVYQVHERKNGKGYPRRVPGEMIHPLAKIVGVADAYAALLSDRPFRPGVQPYKAMEHIIQGVKDGFFEPHVVRLLLQTVSLYPVGSYILLSDGRLAKVIRTNHENYSRPIVRCWPPRTLPSDNSGEIISLLKIPELTVMAALPSPLVG